MTIGELIQRARIDALAFALANSKLNSKQRDALRLAVLQAIAQRVNLAREVSAGRFKRGN